MEKYKLNNEIGILFIDKKGRIAAMPEGDNPLYGRDAIAWMETIYIVQDLGNKHVWGNNL